MEPGIARVAPELREQLVSGGCRRSSPPMGQKILQEDLQIIGALHRAGVPIVAGTDQSGAGLLGLSRDRAVCAGGLHADGSAAGGDHRAGARHEG